MKHHPDFRNAPAAFFCLSLAVQCLGASDRVGKLSLVDTTQYSTLVEMLRLTIRSLDSLSQFTAQPNPQGEFKFTNVTPGRYHLQIPMPARIRTIRLGSQSISPLNFEIAANDQAPLDIVLSLATSDIPVQILGLPPGRDVAAILAPSDPMLTLQESCIVNKVTSEETRFQYIASGKYRLFIVDARFQEEVAKYGPRLSSFLSAESTTINAQESGQTKSTARYIPEAAVERALREAAGAR